MKVFRSFAIILSGVILVQEALAAAVPPPTFVNCSYGGHPRQMLDFWKAPSENPTPLVLYIHGGGWVTGDKKDVAKLHVEKLLTAGISVVSINYRYSTQAQEAGIQPPVMWPMQDAARALQFVRSKAVEWNLDKPRIAATGASAGGCSSLWLAFHDDMADATSSDPIAHESTRLWYSAVMIAQTTLDPQQMQEWTPNSRYGGHAFGLMDPHDLKTRDTRFAEFLKRRTELLPWINEYSPITHASVGDPPIYLAYPSPPAIGLAEKDPTHSANFGLKLQEKLNALGLECELVHPGAADVSHETLEDFLVEQLKR
jgi:acetyl esterase/lipase